MCPDPHDRLDSVARNDHPGHGDDTTPAEAQPKQHEAEQNAGEPNPRRPAPNSRQPVEVPIMCGSKQIGIRRVYDRRAFFNVLRAHIARNGLLMRR